MKNLNGEECYYLHLPQHRGKQKYDFDTNYDIFLSYCNSLEYKDEKSGPYMSKELARKFVDWALDLEENVEAYVDAFRITLKGDEFDEFTNCFPNRLDPAMFIISEHLFCTFISKRESLFKNIRQPAYVFSLNEIPEPVWLDE